MKRLIILLFSIFIVSCNNRKETVEHIPSIIDSLTTEKEIETFIQQNKKHENFKLGHKFTSKEYIDIVDSLNIKTSFFKGDFDGNGYTDLLFTGTKDINNYYTASILLNHGKDSTVILEMERHIDYMFMIIPHPVKRGEKDLIEIYSPDETTEWHNKDKGPRNLKRLLTCIQDNVVEYNNNPKNYSIEKIEFFKGICHGRCPRYELILKEDLSIIYKAKQYNFEFDPGEPFLPNKIEGIFSSKLEKKEYDKITCILNYINFPEINEGTNNGETSRTAIKITYNNGKTKSIYNKADTYYSFDSLLILFENLRTNKNWQPINN